jgi:hypothetical protein
MAQRVHGLDRVEVRLWPCPRPSGRLRTDCSHQLPSRHPRVGQCEQRQHVRRILLQPTEAHFHQSELPLDHAEWMLDLLRVVYLVADVAYLGGA